MMMIQEASSTVHIPLLPRFLYINAWADADEPVAGEMKLITDKLPYSTEQISEDSTVETEWDERTYRRWVGSVYNLKLQRYSVVQGNHFFEALSTAIDTIFVSRMETSVGLRQRMIQWLMDAHNGLNGTVGEGCSASMVLGYERHYKRAYIRPAAALFNQDMHEYLQATSTPDFIWGDMHNQHAPTTIHHHTPPYTTIHHHTPPYITIDHQTPPPTRQ